MLGQLQHLRGVGEQRRAALAEIQPSRIELTERGNEPCRGLSLSEVSCLTSCSSSASVRRVWLAISFVILLSNIVISAGRCGRLARRSLIRAARMREAVEKSARGGCCPARGGVVETSETEASGARKTCQANCWSGPSVRPVGVHSGLEQHGIHPSACGCGRQERRAAFRRSPESLTVSFKSLEGVATHSGIPIPRKVFQLPSGSFL